MSEREPGRLLCDLYRFPEYWARLEAWQKENFARVESAIRADERAKVREECAKLCETGVDMQHPTIRSHTMKAFHKSPTLAAAIRALGEDKP